MAMATLLTQLNAAEGRPENTDPLRLGAALFGDMRKVELRGLLAAAEEEVVGLTLYYVGYDVLTASYGYHLADFVVEECYRRRGVGKQLFAHLAAENLSQGGKWISLTALTNNEAATNFYQSLGLTKVAVDFFAIGPGGLSSIVRKYA